MQISPLWDELYARRWEWANQAFSEFREQLGPALRFHFPEHRREVSIVLYGPSQSGKTTLLLRLLGVRDGMAFQAVQRVLRGGSGLGRSATCTPTLYHWSESERYWELIIPSSDPRAVDDSTLTEELADIRQRVDRGAYRGEDRPIGIGIPLRYRRTPDSPLWPQVLDLPGTNSRNAAERAHAIRVAERHLPAAHVIVLVTQSHNLTPLQPEYLATEMAPLAVWPLAPNRFRVVLTHAVSNNSVRRFVSEHGVTSDSLRMHHLAELLSVLHLAPGSELDPGLLFPVEYGDSWAALERDFPAAYSAARPAVNALIEQLGYSLTGVDSEQMRLLAALRAGPVLAVAGQQRTEELTKRRDRAKSILDGQRAAQTRVTEWVQKGMRTQDIRADELRVVQHSTALARTITVDVLPRLATPVSNKGARRYNDDCRDIFVHGAREAWHTWAADPSTQAVIGRKGMVHLDAGQVRQRAEDTFDSKVKCCHKCDTRWYYIRHWGAPDPQHCEEVHRTCMPKASCALTKRLRKEASDLLSEPKAHAEERRRRASTDLARRRALMQKANQQVARGEEELAVRDQALAEAERQLADALKHARSLERRLEEHWARAVKALYAQLAAVQDEEHQTIVALGILLAYDTRDHLLSADADVSSLPTENRHA